MLALANKLSLNTRPIYRFVNKYSIDFDGVDDRIVTDGADTVAQPTTYSFWCKSSTTIANSGVFGHGGTTIGAFHFNWEHSGILKPFLYLGGSYYVFWDRTTAQDDGEWHHWVVYSEPNNLSNCKLYVDGVLQNTSLIVTAGVLTAYTESLTIGGDRQSGGNYFQGKIDEFAVYDRELTQAEITRMYNSGTPINLNLNASAYQSANPLITSTKSMEFDGTDDYLQLGDFNNLGVDNFSISFWVNLDTAANITFASKFEDNSNRVLFYTDGSNQIATQARVGGAYAWNFTGTGTNVLLTDYLNKWTNITFSIDRSSNLLIFINGELKSTTDISSTSATNVDNTGNWSFGKYGSGSYLNGKMTETGIWNRALTSLEVASLYNQGMPTNLLVNRNNYQSGNPTVFNTKQVDFDGTDDQLKVTNNYGSLTGSISFWINRDNNTGYQYLFDARGSGSGTGFAYFNTGADNLIVSSGTRYVDGVAATSVATDGNWHQVIITGVTLDVDESIRYGTDYGNGLAFEGKMSQIGLWNSTLTADEVSSLYNHGLPIDLTTDQAAYESSSNLVGYWRMGSGTLDTYPLIADQTNATLGSELVTNGDFSTDSDWTLATGWSIANGKLVGNGSMSASANAEQDCGFVNGNTYKFTFEITERTQGSVYIRQPFNGSADAVNEVGTHTFYYVAGSDTRLVFRSADGFAGSIDNVSVKQVNGNPAIMTNQTSSDIENGSPYANIVQNGTFDTDSDWTKASGWVIQNGYAESTALNTRSIYQNTGNTVIGKTYKITFTILETNGGNFKFVYGGVNGTIRNNTGTYTENITATSTDGNIYLDALNVMIGKIDNVTVEEVNTGLQGYWKMGDGTNDEYPVIYDQVNPTLSSELVTNGDFASATGWTIEAVWTISDGAAHGNGASGSSQELKQTILEVGSSYKFVYEIKNYVSGSVELMNSGLGSSSANNIYTGYGVATSTELRFRGSSFNGDIDNVSVKKISGNYATMTNMVEGNITNQYPLTKIRNYYRMGDGILDGYPIIQDQTSPNLAHIPTTNLIEYSEDFSDSYWSKNDILVDDDFITSPDGTQNASKITIDGSTPYLGNNNISLTTGKVYTISCFVKKGTNRWVRLSSVSSVSLGAWFDLENNVVGTVNSMDAKIESYGNGWYRISNRITSISGINQAFLGLSDDDNGTSSTQTGNTVFAWGFQVEEQSQATAYLKSDGIAAVRKSSTTNLITYSEDFSQSLYSIVRATRTSQSAISPSGLNDAYKLESTTTGNSGSWINATVTSYSGVHTISIYAKKGTTEFLLITEVYPNGAVFNLDSGTVKQVSSGEVAAIENVGNGWYRCSYTFTASSSTKAYFIVGNSNTTITLHSATDGNNIYIYGSQLEEQTQAETYAKTTGLPVTIDLFTENNYGTMTNQSASDIVEDTP